MSEVLAFGLLPRRVQGFRNRKDSGVLGIGFRICESQIQDGWFI